MADQDDRHDGEPRPSPGLDSTFELIERARLGDQDALDRLFARHLEPLQRWATGRLPVLGPRPHRHRRPCPGHPALGRSRGWRASSRAASARSRPICGRRCSTACAIELRRHGRRPDHDRSRGGRGRVGRLAARAGDRTGDGGVLRARARTAATGGARGDHRASRDRHDAMRRWRRRSASRAPTRRARRRSARWCAWPKEMSGGGVRASTADLAAAILDGTPIDWAAAECERRRRGSSGARALEALAAVAELHRSRPAQPPARRAAWRERDAVAIGALGPSALARAPRARLLRRGLSRLGRAARPRGRAQAARRAGVAETAARPQARPSSRRAALLARVRHPNVVTLYGAEVIDDRDRTVDGAGRRARRSSSWWRTASASSAAEAVALGIELCSAVAAVHAAGLLHRDIKASNVMVADDGRVVLMDFGTGRELDDADRLARRNAALSRARALRRRPPERGERRLQPRRAALSPAHRLVPGAKRPTLRGLRQAHERGERTRLERERPDLPARLARAIDRALDPDPRRRPERRSARCRADRGIARRRGAARRRRRVGGRGRRLTRARRRDGRSSAGAAAPTPPSRIVGSLGAVLAGRRGERCDRGAGHRRAPVRRPRSESRLRAPSPTASPTRSSATSLGSTDSRCGRATPRSPFASSRAT